MKKVNYWICFALLVVESIFNVLILINCIRAGRSIEPIIMSIFSAFTILGISVFIIKDTLVKKNIIYCLAVYSVIVADSLYMAIYCDHYFYYRDFQWFLLIFFIVISAVMIVATFVVFVIARSEKVKLYIERESEKKEIIKQLEMMKHQLEMEKVKKDYEKLKAEIGE